MTNEIKKVIDPNSPLERRIKIVGETEERILDTSKTQEKIDPAKVAKALGAEPMTQGEAAEFLRKTEYNNNTIKAKDYSKINDLFIELGGKPYLTHRQPEIF